VTRKPRKTLPPMPPPPSYRVADGDFPQEIEWLERRRALLLRSIAEMDHHQLAPSLDPELMPNVAELLIWAKWELGRVEAAIEKLAETQGLPTDPPPDSDPPSRVTPDSRKGRRERA
jgi:hypothetical protein